MLLKRVLDLVVSNGDWEPTKSKRGREVRAEGAAWNEYTEGSLGNYWEAPFSNDRFHPLFKSFLALYQLRRTMFCCWNKLTPKS